MVALVGPHYLQMPAPGESNKFESHSRQMLFRALNTRRVVAVVGAGVSQNYGYPSWDVLALKVANNVACRLKTAGYDATLLERSIIYYSTLGTERDPIALLGQCSELLHTKFAGTKIATIVVEECNQEEDRVTGAKPLEVMLAALQIRRFITTNYDSLIEDRLYTARLNVPRLTNHFSPEDLSALAVGVRDAEGVYHLHGSLVEPDKMVITEDDYQRVYVQTSESYRSYREALRLVFSGNPLLFVGMSFRDLDLLRPLREFTSDRANYEPIERPWFAIMPRSGNPDQDEILLRNNYTQFGIKTIFANLQTESTDNVGSEPTTMCMGLQLEKCLEDIATGWTEWWNDWLRPAIARPDTHDCNTFDKHEMTKNRPDLKVTTFNDREDETRISGIVNRIEALQGSVIVSSAAGTGQGTIELRVRTNAREVYRGSKRVRLFSANLHYSSDLRSTLYAAVEWFSPQGDKIGKASEQSDVFDSLSYALRDSGCILILNGIERIVDSRGRPLDYDSKRLLDLRISNQETLSPSHRLMTPSLVLFSLTSIARISDEQSISEGSPSRTYLATNPLPTVFGRYLYSENGSHTAISASVSSLTPGRRTRRYIEWLTVEAPGASDGTTDAADRFMLLSALSLNAEPVRLSVAQEISEILRGATRTTGKCSPAALQLGRMHLLMTFPDRTSQSRSKRKPRSEGHPSIDDRVSTHTETRSFVREELGASPDSVGEPHRFGLLGFSAETGDPSAYSEGIYVRVRDFLNAISLPGPILGGVGGSPTSATTIDSEGVERAIDLVRTHHGYLRANMNATIVHRFCNKRREGTPLGVPITHYDAYIARLAMSLDCARLIPKSLRSDEIAWSYYELALSAWCQGSLLDAEALAAMTDNSLANDIGAKGLRFELLILRGMIAAERGRLTVALKHYEEALDIGRTEPELSMAARARGHRALIFQLRGEHDRARRDYERSIRDLRKRPGSRGLALFLKHFGDLQRSNGEYDLAERSLRESSSMAESGRHYDILHAAAIAQARLILAKSEPLKAVTANLDTAMLFARRAGLPKLEADAAIVQANISLSEGQYEHAARLTGRVLALANANGMRLRVASGLVMRGRILKARGELSGARISFRSGHSLASQLGYQTQVEIAENQIMDLGSVSEITASDRGRTRPTFNR